jgi:osmotically-inducible protein OsmY
MAQPHVDSRGSAAGHKNHPIEAGRIWSRHGSEDDDGADIVADAVANALHWDLALPRHRVVAQCDGGWVTLTGEVERTYQRSAAEADALRVKGVRGVTNAITVSSGGMGH